MLFLIPLLIALAGVSALCGGIRMALAGVRFRRRALRAAGVVTEIRIDRELRRNSIDGADPPLRRPVVRFRTASGREIETPAATSSVLEALRAGDPVVVLYDPDDPERAQVERNRGTEIAMAAMTGLFGLFLLGASFVSLGFVAVAYEVKDALPSADNPAALGADGVVTVRAPPAAER